MGSEFFMADKYPMNMRSLLTLTNGKLVLHG